MSWRVVRRTGPPGPLVSWSLLAASFFAAVAAGALLLEIQGKPGPRGIMLLLQGGLGTPSALFAEARAQGADIPTALFRGLFWDNFALADSLLKAIPIFLCSLGVAVCFSLQVWNIGAEGQFALGAVGSTAVVLAFPDLPGFAMLPLMFLAAASAGAVWAAIPALLRQTLRVNEIITTLMLNYIGILFLQYLVYGPWKDPGGMGFPMSMEFPPAALIPAFAGRIHWGLALCLAVAVLLELFLQRTRYGFELLAAGENPEAARYAGMRYSAMVVGAMCLCGALAAWAGCLETSATVGRLQPGAAVGYGYTAIVVAWLARLRISRIAFFSFLLAALRVGVENIQLELGVSAAFGDMIQGLLLLCVLAGQFPERYRLKRAGRDFAAPPEGRTARQGGSGSGGAPC